MERQGTSLSENAVHVGFSRSKAQISLLRRLRCGGQSIRTLWGLSSLGAVIRTLRELSGQETQTSQVRLQRGHGHLLQCAVDDNRYQPIQDRLDHFYQDRRRGNLLDKATNTRLAAGSWAFVQG